ncbi:septal ring lytic transglycosylase RlpA family protein [Aureimonas fodinaquatilis]|uniref:Endolytic peptidoglycan transglycosylase RlpA n=1 Tax=Aureimonas fodinaquatilis TaxID=2565783 RepID=A0A5B0DWK9_9HYPH|nr:septal ring lytic transglycosylase RlpA family protein [Aureimonas fodinaquatilis]KAA0970372.1 septal ring lytic transglycosylase RlpA family protein [Aureimonas fodinaquatilis]
MKLTADTLRGKATNIAALVCITALLSACQSGSTTHAELAPEPDAPAFTSAEYGVAASPRVSNLKQVRKGGGREHVGKPYKVRGNWYYPKEEPNYSKSGKASWYGANFHGRLTANGEVYDMYHLSAAHPTFPLPSYARVTNKENGHSVMVRINDRGPFAHGRIVDLSSRAADVLDFKQDGIANVQVDYVGRAPVEGDDSEVLMASFRPGNADPASDGLASGVMVASNTRMDDRALVQTAFLGSEQTGAGMPGVRSLDAIRTAAPTATRPAPAFSMPGNAVTPVAFAPVPTPRSDLLSYASEQPKSRAFSALASLANGQAQAEVIEIGVLTDSKLITRIQAMTAQIGQLEIDAVPAQMGEGASLTLALNSAQSADRVVQMLWDAGATDAFVLRD